MLLHCLKFFTVYSLSQSKTSQNKICPQPSSLASCAPVTQKYLCYLILCVKYFAILFLMLGILSSSFLSAINSSIISYEKLSLLFPGRIKHSLLFCTLVKHLSTMWETWVQSPGWEDSLEKEMAAHSSTLA